MSTPDQPGGIYRQPTPLCEICGEEAVGICGRCSRHFCLDHLVVTQDKRCSDCELQYSKREVRIRKVVGATMATAGAASVVAAAVVSAPVLILAGGVAALAVGGAGALTRLLSRRRFLKEGEGKVQGLMDDAEIRVSAFKGEDPKARPPASRRKTLDVNKYRSGGYGG